MDDQTARALLGKAQEAAQSSYSPYSEFPVGAALLAEDGTIWLGCNVENASYGLTLCAERTAVVKAVSSGNQTFKAIALWAEKPVNHSLTPCGACRQVLAEFCEPAMPVIMAHPTEADGLLYSTVGELLPASFNL